MSTQGIEEIKNMFSEQNEMLSNAFTGVQKQMDLVEKNLGHKIDGVSNRLDGEIIRRTDELASLLNRLKRLEAAVFQEEDTTII